jgi:transposase InsO family protein
MKSPPDLLRDLAIEWPNQAWAADITYIPMRRGFLYLFAVIDWFSRRVLAWRLSNTLTTDCCLEAVREAIHRQGCPEIFNADQGLPIHQWRIHEPAQGARHPDQQGRQGVLAGQCLRRAPGEERQVRGGVSQGL